MHILLTDVLRCPRCGPEFGLVLLADRVEDRRVSGGRLGCANCREAYPVRGGEVDLRVPGGAALPEGEGDGTGGREEAVRLAALLGLAEAWGSVLLVGAGADLADALASLVPGVEVVHAAGRPGEEGAGRVSRVVAGEPLPLAPRSLRGVSLGAGAAGLLEEGARVLAPGGRIVVEGAQEGAAGVLAAAGLRVLLEQEGWVVAERPGGPAGAARAGR